MRAQSKLKVLLIPLFLVLAATVLATPMVQAQVELRLVQTTPLNVVVPPGAPPGTTHYDAGEIRDATGVTIIGEYLRVNVVHPGNLTPSNFNVAAVTITLFFPIPESELPFPMTLQGAHTFAGGNALGSVSASPVSSLVGIPFTLDGSTGVLTLFSGPGPAGLPNLNP